MYKTWGFRYSQLAIYLATPSINMCKQGGLSKPPYTNVARIFNVLRLSSSPIPLVYGQIPLSPSNPKFIHRCLWHLPISFPVTLTTFLCAIDILTSDIDEIRPALGICVIIQASKLGLVVSSGGSGGGTSGTSGNTGDSLNDKDKYNDQLSKCSFNQFNDNKLTLEQDLNWRGGGNDDCGKPHILFHTTFIDCFVDFSEHSMSSNDGGPESWHFEPSFTTHCMIFETSGYMLPFSAFNRPVTF